MSEPLKQSVAYDLMVFVGSVTDRSQGQDGLAASLVIELSKAAGAFATITPTITDRGYGWYKLALTASHTDTEGDLVLHITAPGDYVEDIRLKVSNDYTLLKGMSQINYVLDNTTHTADGMTVARMRIFATGAEVAAATDGGSGEGELATFNVTCSFDGPGKINVYKVAKA